MRLLLTSNGLSNQSIAKALFELVAKPARETSISFIPTAMNVSSSDKSWFVNDLNNLKKQGLKRLDIVDISALPKSMWLPRLESADVLFFSGGNSSHLMRWLKESGLAELLPGLLKTRVYAGISAGSIITNPDLALSNKDKKDLYERDMGYKGEDALGFVDFYLRPHMGAPDKPHAAKPVLEAAAKKLSKKLYGIDDESALKVVDGKVEIISEGEVLVLN